MDDCTTNKIYSQSLQYYQELQSFQTTKTADKVFFLYVIDSLWSLSYEWNI